MSEHAWVLENIETYNAGGLEPDERDRLQQHVAECSGCAQALKEAGAVDQMMERLFAAAQPAAALEDRMIHRLRARPQRNGLPWLLTGCAAAVVLFGFVGAGASRLMSRDELPFPGIWRPEYARSENHLSQLRMADESMSMQTTRGVPNGGMGSTATSFDSERLTKGEIRDPETLLKDAN